MWFNIMMTNALPSGTTVVVLLGTNYSGSHLLSHLLSAHSKCLGVGELHRYQQLLGGQDSAPVVSEYTSQPIYQGLDQIPVEQWHSTLSARAAEDRGGQVPVIIDNSKKVRWVERIAANPRYDVRLVHLVRDPRALVLRWLNTYETPARRRTQRLRVARRMWLRAPRILSGDWATVFTYKWLRENRQINDFIASRRLPSARISYHDVVFDTEPSLRRLMPQIGLEYESGQLQFGDSANLGTTKTAHAASVQRSEIKPDVKWRTQLDPGIVARIEANADVGRFLSELGLAFADNGLVRAASSSA